MADSVGATVDRVGDGRSGAGTVVNGRAVGTRGNAPGTTVNRSITGSVVDGVVDGDVDGVVVEVPASTTVDVVSPSGDVDGTVVPVEVVVGTVVLVEDVVVLLVDEGGGGGGAGGGRIDDGRVRRCPVDCPHRGGLDGGCRCRARAEIDRAGEDEPPTVLRDRQGTDRFGRSELVVTDVVGGVVDRGQHSDRVVASIDDMEPVGGHRRSSGVVGEHLRCLGSPIDADHERRRHLQPGRRSEIDARGLEHHEGRVVRDRRRSRVSGSRLTRRGGRQQLGLARRHRRLPRVDVAG